MQYKANILLSSPLCLPDQADLQMDLTLKYGLTAGWGATAVNYQETLCDWTKGVHDVYSGSDVLKKMERVRLVNFTYKHYTQKKKLQNI